MYVDLTPTTHAPQEYSRQVSHAEGQAFAKRMNSLFIEASAKTAVGVTETFREVVVNILNSPDLWASPASGSSRAGATGKGGAGVGRADNSTMPGTIMLEDGQAGAEGDAGGCGC